MPEYLVETIFFGNRQVRGAGGGFTAETGATGWWVCMQ
jgi:hypothetical protein